jgi:plasmid replication initiation protein
MSRLKNAHAVTKLNVLNEMRANNMTLQELRLFTIYLSKINPRDLSTRYVRFSIEEFRAIMDLKRHNVAYYKKVAESLLSKVIFIPTERGGFTGWTLFSEFKVDSNEHGEWYVVIDANEKALPLLFEFKAHYFKYELWNALRLRGKNQLRMYEILKQYEKVGYRIVSLYDLRNWLGIEEHEYPLFKHFKQNVLEPCKKAVTENTDITFTYEPHEKKGRKIVSLKFNIAKNESYKDPLTLRKFVEMSDTVGDDVKPNLNDITSDDAAELLEAGLITKKEDKLLFMRDAVNNEFTIEQITVLYDIVMRDLPHLAYGDWLKLYHHFMAKYNYMKEKDGRGEIRKPFGYLKSIIGQQ